MTYFARRAIPAALLLGTALLAAGCGKNTTNGAASHPTTPSSSPSTAMTTPSATAAPTATTAAAACTTAALQVKVSTSQGSAAAGSSYFPIDFTNVSGSPCTLFGYPGVSFVTRAMGSQIGAAATRNSSAAATTVTLAPHAVAHATIQVAVAANFPPAACHMVTAHWLKIYPPGQRAAIVTAFTTPTCSAKVPRKDGADLSVYVVRPGAGKAGEGP